MAIVGPSGSGKSTLLHAAAGLLPLSRGQVRYDGEVISGRSDRELSRWRRTQVGFVFQFSYLVQEFSVEENVAVPMLANGVRRKAARARSVQLLQELGLEKLAPRRPGEMSGGELQRIAVARALAHHPRLVLADEPTGSLDSKAGAVVLKMLLAATGGSTALLVVTHDRGIARRMDRTISLRDGRVLADDA